jgi:hypothetical protein
MLAGLGSPDALDRGPAACACGQVPRCFRSLSIERTLPDRNSSVVQGHRADVSPPVPSLRTIRRGRSVGPPLGGTSGKPVPPDRLEDVAFRLRLIFSITAAGPCRYITRRRMPSVRDIVLKLIRRPIRQELIRRYVINCASCSAFNCSTALSSRMTLPRTIISAQIPGLDLYPVVSDWQENLLADSGSHFAGGGLRPLSLRGALSTRQSDPSRCLSRIAASQALLAMTNEARIALLCS